MQVALSGRAFGIFHGPIQRLQQREVTNDHHAQRLRCRVRGEACSVTVERRTSTPSSTSVRDCVWLLTIRLILVA